MWGVFDAPIEETGILTEETGKVWYDQLVGGLRNLGESELPKGAVFGMEYPSVFRINTQVYLQWYVTSPSVPRSQENCYNFRRTEAYHYTQAPGPSPNQRYHTDPSPLPFHLWRPNRPRINHAPDKLHRPRLPQALRHQRHKPLPNTRPNSTHRRAKNTNHPNV